MKPATKVVRGPLVDLLGGADLLDPAAVHDRDPVGHRQRLLLVVGDVDEGDPDLALDPLQLDLQPLAQLQVERAERLVEQQHLRQVDQRPGERDPLLLAARELRRAAVRLGREPDPLELGLDPLARSRPSPTPLRSQAEGDVVLDAQVREERVALEDRVGRALVGGRPATSSPSIRISPSLGCSKPAIIRSVVVLPQPLGPSRVKNSPSRDSRLRSSTATKLAEALGDAAAARRSGVAAISVRSRCSLTWPASPSGPEPGAARHAIEVCAAAAPWHKWRDVPNRAAALYNVVQALSLAT